MTKIAFVLVLIITAGCYTHKKLPTKTYYQFNYQASYTYANDTLKVVLKNPLNCPLRIWFSSPDSSQSKTLAGLGILTLKEKGDTTFKYYWSGQKGIALQFNSGVGDADKVVVTEKLSLPFPRNRTYTIIQGYNGWHSHHSNNSRFAIDFSLKIKDTVCSAADGYVVGVIKDYKYGGNTEDWTDYANYITIYHPQSGLFTQYVHLVKNGVFVKVGDEVTRGQPIGLAGMTGFTNVAHLHFNVLKPDKNGGWVSTPIEFEEGYKGADLTINTVVRK